jgi:hypothetical protein
MLVWFINGTMVWNGTQMGRGLKDHYEKNPTIIIFKILFESKNRYHTYV